MQRINPAAPLTPQQKYKRYYEAHREEVLEKNRNYCKNNKAKVNRTRRNYRHGLRQETFDAMLAAQNNRCAVCDNEFQKTPHVDHDHRCCPPLRSCDACRRGLLCDDCNLGIGRFHDDPALLTKAIAYLERHTK